MFGRRCVFSVSVKSLGYGKYCPPKQHNSSRGNSHLFFSKYAVPDRECLPASYVIQTRVQDTDLQGHINNVNYYAFMDSAIVGWSVSQGDVLAETPRFIAETGLRYITPGQYPEPVDVRFGVQVHNKFFNRLNFE